MRSIPKFGSMGKKIGTNIIIITVQSSGQPNKKINIWDISKNPAGDKFIENTQLSNRFCPPSAANVEEKTHDPTNNQITIDVVREVRKTDSFIFFKSNFL